MTKKPRNITGKIMPFFGILGLLLIWQIISAAGALPEFMLPSPLKVLTTFFVTMPNMAPHLLISLFEAVLGLVCGIILAFLLAVSMDKSEAAAKIVYPVLVMSQAVPAIAIAPLLVLWFGYDLLPKVLLVLLVCFFPLAVGLYDGLKSSDKDSLNLLSAMGASEGQIFWHAKFPLSLGPFFSGLKIAVSYAIVGAVIAEWLGGESGLGVYMTMARKSFAYDKMFAVILLIILITLIAIWLVKTLERISMPHLNRKNGADENWEE